MVNARRELRRYLKHTQQSQADLARALDISPSLLSMLLHGRRRPSLDLAFRIESVTGVKASSFAEVA